MKMNLRKAQILCSKIDAQYGINGTKWNDVYSSEQELLDDLKNIYIPKNKTAPVGTFKGYEYIYSFAYYVQKGWELSDKQIRQAKRLAKEIKKASMIAECYKEE